MEGVKRSDAASDSEPTNLVFDVSAVSSNIFHAIQEHSPNWLDRIGVDPRERHPIFYGCYDWHSAVHSHLSLLILLNRLKDIDAEAFSDLSGPVFSYLRTRINTENALIEQASLEKLPDKYECPYGLAWFTKLHSYLEASEENAEYREWALVLLPLAEIVRSILLRWIKQLTDGTLSVDRSGWHGNTAFSLLLIIEACADFGSSVYGPLLNPCLALSFKLYINDRGISDPCESCAFLSPPMSEVELISKCFRLTGRPEHELTSETGSGPAGSTVITSVSFLDWFEGAIDQSVWDLCPDCTGDPSDPYKSHTCGLNFARARNLSEVANYLQCCLDKASDEAIAAGKDVERIKRYRSIMIPKLIASARAHYELSLPTLATGSFMGDHWLASFAIRAAECLKNNQHL